MRIYVPTNINSISKLLIKDNPAINRQQPIGTE